MKNILNKIFLLLIAMFMVGTITSCKGVEAPVNTENRVRRVVTHGTTEFNREDVIGRIRLITTYKFRNNDGDLNSESAFLEIINDTGTTFTIYVENALRVSVPTDSYFADMKKEPSNILRDINEVRDNFLVDFSHDYFTVSDSKNTTDREKFEISLKPENFMTIGVVPDQGGLLNLFDTMICTFDEHLGENNFFTILTKIIRQNYKETSKYELTETLKKELKNMSLDWLNAIPTEIRQAAAAIANGFIKIANGEFTYKDFVEMFNDSYEQLLWKIEDFRASRFAQAFMTFFDQMKRLFVEQEGDLYIIPCLIELVANVASIYTEGIRDLMTKTNFGGVTINEELYVGHYGLPFETRSCIEAPLTYGGLLDLIDYLGDQDYYNALIHNEATVAAEGWNVAVAKKQDGTYNSLKVEYGYKNESNGTLTTLKDSLDIIYDSCRDLSFNLNCMSLGLRDLYINNVWIKNPIVNPSVSGSTPYIQAE